jgi:hypothetical protein
VKNSKPQQVIYTFDQGNGTRLSVTRYAINGMVRNPFPGADQRRQDAESLVKSTRREITDAETELKALIELGTTRSLSKKEQHRKKWLPVIIRNGKTLASLQDGIVRDFPEFVPVDRYTRQVDEQRTTLAA